MLAVHLENLLFLLLLVVAGLFQLLGKAARKANTSETKPESKPQRRVSKPIPRGGGESDQERIRKFLEALGNPPPARTPPPVAKPPTYRKPLVLTRIPPLASPLPPLVTRPPDLPTEVQSPAQTILVPIEPREKRGPALEPMFQVHESQPVPEPIAAADEPGTKMQSPAQRYRTDITTLLKSPFALRDAIIVREILGPPRGVLTFDERSLPL
jgi:hypothetical protein